MITDTTRQLFADRNFRLYTLASVISWLSFFAQTLAVSWLAWELTHSPTWLAVITVLDIAPYFLLGPWGSVLADRLDRNPGLEVRMVVDIQRSFGDTTGESELVARYAADFRRQQWPGATLPSVFYDPRSLALDQDSRSSMHAKCVVADRAVALVTSANFTAAAQQRNFELGLLVRDLSLAGLVWDHFDALIRAGALRSLHFGAGTAP